MIRFKFLSLTLLHNPLCQNFALFGANEPRFKLTIFEQVYNYYIQKDDRVDFSQASHNIVRDLKDPVLDMGCLFFQLLHSVVQSVPIHLRLSFWYWKPQQCTTHGPAHLVKRKYMVEIEGQEGACRNFKKLESIDAFGILLAQVKQVFYIKKLTSLV